MPVPTNIEPLSGAAPPQPLQKSQKSMTKAERRELQESQRAAKLSQNAGVPSPLTGTPAVVNPSKTKPPSTPSQKKFQGDIHRGGHGSKPSISGSKSLISKDLITGPSAAVDDSVTGRNVSRGLRIFSHFGLPKPIGHTIKGDIHPAIVSLALLFSDFRICGSNARCIATLTAFKTVCLYLRENFVLSNIITGYTRLYNATS